MNFIKKIFEDKVDEAVHAKFTRFSKGVFERRAVYKVRISNKIKINTTFEYVNDLVEFFFSLSDKCKENGKILLREDINLEELGLEGVKKKKRGFYEIEIDQELSKDQIQELSKKVYYFLLNLTFEGGELKIIQKLPRSSKGKEGKVKDKFCVAIIDSKYKREVMQDYLFDVKGNCKSAAAEHTFEINEIITPKNVESHEEARLLAKRKGKVTRTLMVDKKEQISEKSFII